MSTVVFAGPTIPAREIEARIACTVLPPAAQGDVLRATRAGARTIALIDGVFERVLPVWHKEILWALSQGVQVWGAASMGALRAAELHAFGMRGVGWIFAAYRDGSLEADDEVAVLHGPAEVGFAAVTEALVNVRATLDAALAAGVLDPDAARAGLAAARALHYRERTWEAIAAASGAVGGRLRAWVAEGRVDRKRLDAMALLEALAAESTAPTGPAAAGFTFAWTDAWDALFHGVGGSTIDELVLDELRLQPERLVSVRRLALLRLLARREAQRTGREPDRTALGQARDGLRERLGLWRAADLRRWLAERDLDDAGFDLLAADEALLAQLGRESGGALAAAMLAELRAGGGYLELAARAHAKAQALDAAGLADPSAEAPAIDAAPVLAALAERAGGEAGWDPRTLAGQLGFSDPAALERAALREQEFVRIITDKNDGAT